MTGGVPESGDPVIRADDGHWLTVHASRLVGESGEPRIALVVEAAQPQLAALMTTYSVMKRTLLAMCDIPENIGDRSHPGNARKNR